MKKTACFIGAILEVITGHVGRAESLQMFRTCRLASFSPTRLESVRALEFCRISDRAEGVGVLGLSENLRYGAYWLNCCFKVSGT